MSSRWRPDQDHLQRLDAWASARLAQRLELWVMTLLDTVRESRRQHPFLHGALVPTLYAVAEFLGAVRAVRHGGAGRVVLLHLGYAANHLTERTMRTIEAMKTHALQKEPPAERLMN